MKKLSALFTACLAVSFGFAQTAISITVDDLANKNDEVTVSIGNPFDAPDFSLTGENVIWNYGSLTSTLIDTVKWLDEEDTNPLYFFLWFAANVAEETGQEIANEFFTFEDIFNFYDRSSSALKQTGIAGTISGIPLQSIFDEEDVIFELPLNYDDAFTSSGSYAIEIPTIGGWTETRNRSTIVDGWGIVITPFGEFEALRTKSTINIDNTITIEGIGELPFSYTSIEYKWLAKEMLIPVLQFTAQDIFGFETITSISFIDTAEVIIVDALSNQYGSNAAINLFPNPAVNQLLLNVNLQKASIFNFEIINLMGQKVFISNDFIMQDGSNTISTALQELQLPSGHYIMNCYSQNTFLQSIAWIKK